MILVFRFLASHIASKITSSPLYSTFESAPHSLVVENCDCGCVVTTSTLQGSAATAVMLLSVI